MNIIRAIIDFFKRLDSRPIKPAPVQTLSNIIDDATLKQDIDNYKVGTASYIIVGYSHNNEDGQPRQKIIKKCQVHERIIFKHTPMPDYPRAIQVWTVHGMIGYVSEDNNNAVLNKMTKAVKTVARIRKFLQDKHFKIVVVEVYYCKDMPQ